MKILKKKKSIPRSLTFLIILILIMSCAGKLTFNLPFGLSYAMVEGILGAIVEIMILSAQSLESIIPCSFCVMYGLL